MDSTIDHKALSAVLKEIPFDLRVEVVVSDMLKNGFTLEDYFIQPVGIFRRRFDRDIESVDHIELPNGTEYNLIRVSREGLYDTLPQGLFHNPPGKGTKAFKQVSEMSEEVKIRKREVKEARDFFLIYEIEMYYQRLAVEWHERNLIDTISITMDDEDFLSYWSLPGIFNKNQKGILFYLYPIINKIRGNPALMEKVYSMILGDPITISVEYRRFHSEAPCVGYNIIGSRHLGYDLVMGERPADIYHTLIQRVGPLEPLKVSQYLPQGRNHKVLMELNRFFVPYYMETELKMEVTPSEWKLSSGKGGVRLGINSQLSAPIRA